MNKLIAAVALATTILASPAFAQSYDPGVGTGNIAPQIAAPALASPAQGSPYSAYGAVTPYGSPVAGTSAARPTVAGTSTARAKVLNECSVLAAPYKEMTWGTMQIQTFRSCMARHGQPE